MLMKHLFLLFGSFFYLAAGFAQTRIHALDSVTVTAEKFPQKQSRTGKSVSIIGPRTLARSQGMTLGQILNTQAGIIINGSQGPDGTNQSVFLDGASDNHVLILMDGIPINDPTQISEHTDLNLIPVSMIDRIEIMYGGASTLYGSGAISGVINIITKQGSQKPLAISAGLQAGSYGTYGEQAGIRGRSKSLEYSVQGDLLDSRGFPAALDTSGNGNFTRDGFHRGSWDARLGLQLLRGWELHPFLFYSSERGNLAQGAFTDDRDYTYTSRQEQAGLSSSLRTGSHGTLNLLYQYETLRRNYLNDTLDHSDYLKSDNLSRINQVDLYWDLQPDSAWQLLLGADYTWDHISLYNLSISSYGPYESDLGGDSAHMNQGSLYGSLLYHGPWGFHLELGGRLNRQDQYGTVGTFTLNPFFVVRDGFRVYANLSSGYNAPSLYQLYTPYYGNPALRPEKSLEFQLGADWALGSGLDLALSGFSRRVTRLIGFTDHYVNIDHQSDAGARLRAVWNPGHGLRFSVYYFLVKGRIFTSSSLTGKDTSYANLFKRPQNSFGLNLSWQAGSFLWLQASLQYQGRRMDLFFNDLSFAEEPVWLNPYALLNLSATYPILKGFRAFLQLDNITGTRYIETTGYRTRGFNLDGGLLLDL